MFGPAPLQRKLCFNMNYMQMLPYYTMRCSYLLRNFADRVLSRLIDRVWSGALAEKVMF